MSSRDEEWWKLQAGEFVLGTLDNHERDLFENIRRRDPEFQQRVTRWQEKLAPLDRAVPPLEPPAHVWKNIESTIGIALEQPEFNDSILDHTAALKRVQDDFRFDDLAEDVSATHSGMAQSSRTLPKLTQPADTAEQASPPLSVNQSQNPVRSPNVWRDLTVLASAACLILAMIVWNANLRQESPGRTENPPPFDVISVINSDQSGALWVVNGATKSNTLQVSVVGTPEPVDGKTYQLWMLEADGETARPMGLLPETAGQTVMIDTPELTPDAVAFAVSLEPRGGSTQSTPSGAVIFESKFLTLVTTGE